ncbi:MAG: hypothetical protein WBC19_05055 [Pyrinomonadaceae bacterium]|nr:hypothetical protein [Chloracidobacterium sp.]
MSFRNNVSESYWEGRLIWKQSRPFVFESTAWRYVMKVVRFSMYYVNLQLGVIFGLRHTSHPLGLNWRWRFWQQRDRAQRQRRFSGD